MSAGWVAGSVRARALVRRRLGRQRVRQLAAAPTLDEALEVLATTPYEREVRPGASLARAQHGVAAATLWHLRVLAGWLPREGVSMIRVLAGWFEIANVDELAHALARRVPLRDDATFRLGTLATAWPQLRRASSLAELRAALAASAWGDPGEDSARAIRLALRGRWAARVAAEVPAAATWAAGGAALLVTGARLAAGREPPPACRDAVAGLLGPAALEGGPPAEVARKLPAEARWALAGVESGEQLWRAHGRWWARVERDGFALLRRSEFSAAPVLGAIAVLAVDAWRVRAALELAARGGAPLEEYDAVA